MRPDSLVGPPRKPVDGDGPVVVSRLACRRGPELRGALKQASDFPKSTARGDAVSGADSLIHGQRIRNRAIRVPGFLADRREKESAPPRVTIATFGRFRLRLPAESRTAPVGTRLPAPRRPSLPPALPGHTFPVSCPPPVSY